VRKFGRTPQNIQFAGKTNLRTPHALLNVDAPRQARTAVPAPEFAPLIELSGVEKSHRMGRVDYPALRGVDLAIGAGELVAIVGPSESGKTTILNLVGRYDLAAKVALPDGG